MMHTCSIAAIAIAALFAAPAYAQVPGKAVANAEVPAVSGAVDDALEGAPAAPAAPVSPVAPAADRSIASSVKRSGSIAVDGRLDEAAWAAAPVQRNFWQRAPHEGKPPQHDTEFRVLHDAEALYVGVRARDSAPAQIRGVLTRRDEESPSDWITIGIDSYFDRRTAFLFALNPAGVQRDILMSDDVNEDPTWDAIWDGASAVDGTGWTAEFRIPFQQLRFSADDMTWGLQVTRTVARSQEETAWQPWPPESPRFVSLFGTLTGVQGVDRGRHVELLPYASLGGATATDESSEALYGLGLDAKYALSSNTVLTATVNPDFGQVEADPSEVNLTAFETFLSERRSFFLEGADLFTIPIDDASRELLFYSRRIGGAPQLDADGDRVDAPTATTIYGAAKVTGKTASGWSFGVLEAVTAREEATVTTEGMTSKQPVEPLTSYSMARLRKDFSGGRTSVGGLFTGVHRDLDAPVFEEAFHDRAYTGGLEMSHRTSDNRWYATAKVYGSHVHGSADAIAWTQAAPQRYLQRPDADHVELDPTRTSMAGMGWQWSLYQRGSRHWRYGVGSLSRSPELEVNDMGYQQLADHYTQWGWLQYRDDAPGDWLRKYELNLNLQSTLDWDPRPLNHRVAVSARTTLNSQWEAAIGGSYDRRLWDPRRLRGGPSLRIDDATGGWVELWSDPRRALQFGVTSKVDVVPATSSYFADLRPAVEWHARSNLQLSLELALEARRAGYEFVANTVDTDGAPRHVVGELVQRTAMLTLRGGYTLTPRLSLQVYVSPFLTAGRYETMKEVIDPSARALSQRFHELGAGELTAVDGVYTVDRDGDGMPEYGFRRPNFDFQQGRSNVVLRWEYLPGSTAFLIWSHERTGGGADGRFILGDELAGLRDARSNHTVLAKLTYWIGL